MQNSPRFSIITPSLNQGKFIEQTICSVLSQQEVDLEYIVMDGGSSDETSSILEKYNGELKWRSEPDGGQTEAINNGLRLATGDIVCYLNADDLFLPGALQKVAHRFNSQPQVMWLTGQCSIVDSENREVRRPITVYKNLLLRLRSFSLLLMTNFISQPATFWRRSLLDELGLPDEDFRYVMDYEYWLRLYAKYPPAFLPEYLACFKIHPASKTTSTGHKDAYVREEQAILKKYASAPWQLRLHDVHRSLMTLAYSIMNRSESS